MQRAYNHTRHFHTGFSTGHNQTELLALMMRHAQRVILTEILVRQQSVGMFYSAHRATPSSISREARRRAL
jgi:hypothetical protein